MPLYDGNPLAEHRLFATANADEALRRVAGLMCPHTLRILGDARRLDLAWHRAALGNVEFHYFRYGVEAMVETRIGASVLVEIPLRGSGITRQGELVMVVSPGRAVVVSPHSSLRAEFSRECAKLLILIPEFALRRYLRDVTGASPNEPIRFQAGIDLDRGRGAVLRRTIEFVLGEIEAAGPLQGALRRVELERMLLATLLETQENDHSRTIAQWRARPEPDYVGAAERFIRTHADAALTMTALAGACGVSERTLHDGFRRHRGIPPLAMLRELRFAKARDALLAAPPGTTTVAAIATAWGFDELGRFATEYRRRFAESPSSTLRRAAAIVSREGAQG
jgi:AraC-like DNA-binding protein